MSTKNGEKARAAIAKKNRTARREKDRAKLAALKGAAGDAAKSGKESASSK